MGLRRVLVGTLVLLLASAVTASAAPHEPVVFAVGWGEVAEHFFPHPSICVGEPEMDRQRAVGPGFLFDPDGCGSSAGEAILSYAKADGVGARSLEDPLYVQPLGVRQVGGGDLRLGEGAPVALKPSDKDVGLTTHRVDATWDFVDRDGDARWTAGDVAYLDGDANGHLSPGDLVLDGHLRRLPLDAPGMFYALSPATAGLCFVDDDGSGSWGAGEPAYMVLGRECDYVAAGDLRIVATRGQQPGSRVIEAAFDFMNPLTAFPAPQGLPAVADGSPVFDLDGSGTLTEADRMMESLAAPDGADGAALASGGTWAFLDLDGDRTAGPSDLIYIDRDDNGRTSAGDMRLHSLGAQPFGSLVSAGDADDMAALPPKQQPPNAEAASGSQHDDGESKKTPGPALLSLLGALLLILARSRRA